MREIKYLNFFINSYCNSLLSLTSRAISQCQKCVTCPRLKSPLSFVGSSSRTLLHWSLASTNWFSLFKHRAQFRWLEISSDLRSFSPSSTNPVNTITWSTQPSKVLQRFRLDTVVKFFCFLILTTNTVSLQYHYSVCFHGLITMNLCGQLIDIIRQSRALMYSTRWSLLLSFMKVVSSSTTMFHV